MKSIATKAIIEGIRARKDGSLGLSVTTPELTVQEKALFMELQNLNIDLLITPLDVEEAPDEIKINADLESKTPSQRLRGSLYRLHESELGRKPTSEEWESFYRQKMEKIIQWVQNKIDQ